MTRQYWDDERRAVLSRLWVVEGLSSGEIATRLGISRGSVMGQVNTLGLIGAKARPEAKPKQERIKQVRPPRPGPSAVKQRVARARKDAALKAAPIAPTAEIVVIDGARFRQQAALASALQLLDLDPRHCRFPVGSATGAQQLFCAEVCPEGETYCETCRPIVHRARDRSRQRGWDGFGQLPRFARA